MKFVQSNVSGLFLFILIAILTSCSKSDDLSPAFSLVGSWRVTNSTSTECTDPSQNSSTDYVVSPPTASMQMSLEYTFTSDNKVTISYLLYLDDRQGASGLVSNGTYSLKGNKLTVKVTSMNSIDPETTEVDLSGDILTMERGRTSEYDCITIFTLTKF